MGQKITSRQQALDNGFDFYYTGKPCSKNHVTFRKVESGECIDCAELYLETTREESKRRKQSQQSIIDTLSKPIHPWNFPTKASHVR